MKTAPSADFTEQVAVLPAPVPEKVKQAREEALAFDLAKTILNDPRRDPDSTPSLLARQLLRSRERGLARADKIAAETEKFIEGAELASGSRNLLVMGVQWFRKRLADEIRKLDATPKDGER